MLFPRSESLVSAHMRAHNGKSFSSGKVIVSVSVVLAPVVMRVVSVDVDTINVVTVRRYWILSRCCCLVLLLFLCLFLQSWAP